jgi:hypothetical protein
MPIAWSKVTSFASIQKYGGRVGYAVVETAGLADGLSQREPPRSERNLLLGTECTKGQEGLGFTIEIDGVVGMGVDVVGGLVNERSKGSYRASALPL